MGRLFSCYCLECNVSLTACADRFWRNFITSDESGEPYLRQTPGVSLTELILTDRTYSSPRLSERALKGTTDVAVNGITAIPILVVVVVVTRHRLL